MNVPALIAMFLAIGFSYLFTYVGVKEFMTIQGAILTAAMLATGLICMSNIEK